MTRTSRRYDRGRHAGIGFARFAVAALLGLGLLARRGAAGTLTADTVVVDVANPNCREDAAGTAADPFCSITAALTNRHAPGTVILVLPGTYREQVTLPASGAPDELLCLVAAARPGEPVVIEGAEDFGQPGLWTPASGDVWLARGVTWIPRQVRAHGARLAPWSGALDAMPEDSWSYVLGTGLYVNVAGDPAGREVHVGQRRYGFYLPNREYVRIEGFTILEADDRGIQLNTGSNHDEIVGNVVRWSNRIGIQAIGTRDSRFANNTISECGDHGISLRAGTTGCTVEGNESSGNAFPGQRRANGLYMFECPGNLVRGNRWHHNQDSGEHIQSGSDSVISIQNLSWANGDHGFDRLGVIGCVLIGDVAHGNYKDGFSFEGGSTDCQVHDCIAVENGTTSNEADLWVDAESMPGLGCDDNLFWNSTPQPPIKLGLTRFGSVPEWSVTTGYDTRTLQLDPRFVDPVAGDFRLQAGSPAIDNANSGIPGWPALDARGAPRVDDLQSPNAGLGPVSFGDRGAFEFDDVGTTTAGVPAGFRGPESLEIRPDPVRGVAELRFALERAGGLHVAVYDLGGRRVRTLRGGETAAGDHRVAFDARADDGRPLESGVYFVRVQGPDGARSRRFLVLR